MTENKLIKLVRLYNRLSFYFCLTGEKPNINITDDMKVEDLINQLDKTYEKYKKTEDSKRIKKDKS